MDKIRVSVTLLALLLWTSLVAQAEGHVARLKDHPFQEAYRDEAPVSGRVIAGISLVGVPVSTEQMALLPPASAAGKSICVQVMSRDGRYWSQNSFELPTEISVAAVALEYLSKHQDFLHTLKQDELAMLGSVGDCEDTDRSKLLLTSTSKQGDSPARIEMFVNSSRADTYIAVKNHISLRRPMRCRVIEEGRRTTYDTICSLELSELGTQANEVDLRILRRRYERMLPATEFTLELPPLKEYAMH